MRRGRGARRSPTELRRLKRGGLRAGGMTEIPTPLFRRAPARLCADGDGFCASSEQVFRMAPPTESGTYGRVHTRSRVDFHDVTFQFALDIDLSFSAHFTNRLPVWLASSRGRVWERSRFRGFRRIRWGWKSKSGES